MGKRLLDPKSTRLEALIHGEQHKHVLQAEREGGGAGGARHVVRPAGRGLKGGQGVSQGLGFSGPPPLAPLWGFRFLGPPPPRPPLGIQVSRTGVWG